MKRLLIPLLAALAIQTLSDKKYLMKFIMLAKTLVTKRVVSS